MNESNKSAAPKRGGRPPANKVHSKATTSSRTNGRKNAGSPSATAYLEYQGRQMELSGLFDTAKAEFRKVHKRMHIEDIKVYIKPEDYKVYYLINGQYDGSFAFQ